MAAPRARALHWVYKIGNLRKSLDFFEGVLGMHVLRHEEFGGGCEASCNGPYQRPWSKTMIGYGAEIDHFVLELTYNYGIRKYEQGNDLSHLTIADKESILSRAKSASCEVIEENGSIFVASPDGYRFKLIDRQEKRRDPMIGVCVRSHDIIKSKDYYTNVLGMTLVKESSTGFTVSFDSEQQASLEVEASEEPINHAKAFGRIAFAAPDISPFHEAVQKSNDRVLHEPITLETPGKADCRVVILQDRDDYEICIAGEEGFNALSEPKVGADKIDWEQRAELGADK